MKQLIETTFPCKTGNCIEIRKETIFWVDEYPSNNTIPKQIRGKSFTLLKTEDERLFTVNNPFQKEIYFLAIDKGIFTDEDKFKKCDFALFDKKRFCFIESKNSKLNQRKEDRLYAYEQLKNTIRIFQNKIDFTNYQVEAQVSFKASQIYPRQTSSNQDMVKEFDDELAVALFENNDIEF